MLHSALIKTIIVDGLGYLSLSVNYVRFILHRKYAYAKISVRIQGRNGVPPGTAPTVPGKGWYHAYHTIQTCVCDTRIPIIRYKALFYKWRNGDSDS